MLYSLTSLRLLGLETELKVVFIILGRNASKKRQTTQMKTNHKFKEILMLDSIKIGDIFKKLWAPIIVYSSHHPVKGFNSDPWGRAVPYCRGRIQSRAKDGGRDLLMTGTKTSRKPFLVLCPCDRAGPEC